MGQTATETVREIEETRRRLDGELRLLEARLPSAAVWGKRIAGALLGGGFVAATFWALVRRRRSAKRERGVKDLDRRVRRLEARMRDLESA